jgi:hypothetical protein
MTHDRSANRRAVCTRFTQAADDQFGGRNGHHELLDPACPRTRARAISAIPPGRELSENLVLAEDATTVEVTRSCVSPPDGPA